MRYFIDTEYDWNHQTGTIVPISIGIVAEDGREYYAVNRDFDQESASQWLKDNVISFLYAEEGSCHGTKATGFLARDLLAFIGNDVPEFWGDYAAFDYVVLSMIMGDFSDWPRWWPMHINDLQQEAIPSIQAVIPHHALSDARAARDAWNHAFAVAAPTA